MNKNGFKNNKVWVGEIIIDEGIKHAPDLHKYGVSKIKNKKVLYVILICKLHRDRNAEQGKGQFK